MDAEKLLLMAAAVGGAAWVVSRLSATSDGVPITSTEARVLSLAPVVWDAALAHTVDPAIISAVIHRESAGKIDASGADGEVGLMQILPATATWICGITGTSLWDARTNVNCGTRYLAYNLVLAGAVVGMVASYNAGAGNVLKVQDGFKMPASTASYVSGVLGLSVRYRSLFSAMPDYSVTYGVLFPAGAWPLAIGRIWHS